jgi:hypothetical protein
MQYLSCFPAQEVTLYLQVTDADGYFADGYTDIDGYYIPSVTRMILPDLTSADGYPQAMTKYSTGLYYYKFTLPRGAISVGAYMADVMFLNPQNNNINHELYHISVNAPYGNFSALSY